jgi:hypothetical protein
VCYDFFFYGYDKPKAHWPSAGTRARRGSGADRGRDREPQSSHDLPNRIERVGPAVCQSAAIALVADVDPGPRAGSTSIVGGVTGCGTREPPSMTRTSPGKVATPERKAGSGSSASATLIAATLAFRFLSLKAISSSRCNRWARPDTRNSSHSLR